MQHCSFAQTISDARYSNPDTYKVYDDYTWIMNDCKAGYHKQLNLTSEQVTGMKVRDAYHWGDVIFAQEFANQTQPTDLKYDWTYLQNQEVDLTQIVGLTATLTNKVRKLFTSSNFIEAMEDIRNLTTNGTSTTDIPNYRIYSAHDFQIANLMIALKPEYELNVVPYASTIKFELYKNNLNEYTVNSIYNGEHLKLGDCEQEYCPIDKWFAYMNKQLYTKNDELMAQCALTPTADDYKNDAVTDWHFNQTIKTESQKKNN